MRTPFDCPQNDNKIYDIWSISEAIDVVRVQEGTDKKSMIRTATASESSPQSTPESILLRLEKIEICYTVN